MKEHALLTRFSCHEFPKSYTKHYQDKLWDVSFVKRVFKRKSGIRVKDVEEKLKEMKKSSMDRKKLTILNFICKIVKANSKADGDIDCFLLSIVDDLNACGKFSWGHYTFDEGLKWINA